MPFLKLFEIKANDESGLSITPYSWENTPDVSGKGWSIGVQGQHCEHIGQMSPLGLFQPLASAPERGLVKYPLHGVQWE